MTLTVCTFANLFAWHCKLSKDLDTPLPMTRSSCYKNHSSKNHLHIWLPWRFFVNLHQGMINQKGSFPLNLQATYFQTFSLPSYSKGKGNWLASVTFLPISYILRKCLFSLAVKFHYGVIRSINWFIRHSTILFLRSLF